LPPDWPESATPLDPAAAPPLLIEIEPTPDDGTAELRPDDGVVELAPDDDPETLLGSLLPVLLHPAPQTRAKRAPIEIRLSRQSARMKSSSALELERSVDGHIRPVLGAKAPALRTKRQIEWRQAVTLITQNRTNREKGSGVQASR
jgi:hypothetical protein